jgi:uncharacterized protein (TIGR02117 family)
LRLLRQALRAGRRRALIGARRCRALRRLGLVLSVAGLLPLGWVLAGLVGAALPSGGTETGGDGPVEIRLFGTLIHYDFLLPATPEARAAFAFAARAGVPIDAPGTEWILAGWGARDFYTATGRYVDMRAGPVWRALTGDASVLRVDAYGPVGTEGTIRLRLSRDAYARLLKAIAASRAGPILPHPGFTDTDAFFEGAGRFDALRTCNVWAGAMLRAAGLRLGAWTPTPQALRLSLRLWTDARTD